MRLSIHGHGVGVTPTMASRIQDRVRSAMEPFGRRVDAVTVRVSRLADHGSDFWACSLLIDLHPGGGLGLGQTDAELPAAIDRAVERAVAAVAVELARRQARRDAGIWAYSLSGRALG